MYIKHVEELFERYKGKYYTGTNKTAPLEIWWKWKNINERFYKFVFTKVHLFHHEDEQEESNIL